MRKFLQIPLRKFCSKKTSLDMSKYDKSQTKDLHDKLILVDESDSVIGSISKVDAHLNSLNKSNPHHRAFSAFLFNKQNELLIHQRSDKKITFPLYWTNSCCSHPLHTPEEMIEANNVGIKKAIRRRVNYELGIDLETIEDYHFMGKFTYEAPFNDQWGEKELDYCFIIQRDFSLFKFNENEIKEIKWVKRNEIVEFIQNRIDTKKENITPWFEMILKQHFFKWWELLEKGKISTFQAKNETQNFMKAPSKRPTDDKDQIAGSINLD